MAKRRGRRRKRAKGGLASWKIILAVFGGVLVLLTTAGVAFAASKLGKIETTQLDVEKLNISDEVEYNETGYLNVALFGLDSRDNTLGAGERSDTIMIASLNRETKEVKMCSIFRDTLLQQSDGSYNKANAAYAFGGAEDAVAMLNKNLDMDIQHYVTVNFNALADVIDLLGGIELELTGEEAYWVNGYITETSKVVGRTTELLDHDGKMTLDGIQAVSYARIRYTSGDDFKRAERQRLVLEQIVKKAQSADLSTINKIIDKVFPKIATNFTLTEILAYAKDAFDYKLGKTSGFPFDNSTATLTGVGSSVIPQSLQSNVIQLHEFLFGDDGYTYSSTVAEISDEIQNHALYSTTDDTSEYNDYSGTDYYNDPYSNSDTYSSGQYNSTTDVQGTGGYGGNTDVGNSYEVQDNTGGGTDAGTATENIPDAGVSDSTADGTAGQGTDTGLY
ncbi:LCP family protein [Luxibacter massiliensis]|uniref:LCP family protein n=1 Tax=Luxibacter massiliensis TaxID=2219695 RepID=UPI000F064ED1|nr:LCP family protein [Luxibacter massiliensis]